MARRKPLNTYPREYFNIFRIGDRQAINIVHETKEQAMATRNELYTFRQVLYDEGDGHLEELKSAAQNVRLSVTEATLTVEPIRRKKDESVK